MDFVLFFETWADEIFMWTGFGTLVGLLAKALMPGPDPGGAVATLAMGIGGAVLGCAVFGYFIGGERIVPISPQGTLIATAGAFTLLFFYRLLGGHLIEEGEDVPRFYRRRQRPQHYSRTCDE